MKDHQNEPYEAPVIEDVDTTLGTVATTPGIIEIPSDVLGGGGGGGILP